MSEPTSNPFSDVDQEKFDAWLGEGGKGRFVLYGDWIAEDVNRCTCAAPEFGYTVLHEHGCGLEPICTVAEFRTLPDEWLRRLLASAGVPPAPGLPSRLADDVAREMARQVDKWGVQHHPDGTGPAVPLAHIGLAAAVADSARTQCQNAAARDKVTWRHILLEEIFEGMAEESGSPELDAELVQAAAVIFSWLRDKRGRRGDG